MRYNGVMRYASYGNGRPLLWLVILVFLFLGGFRVMAVMLGLLFALFPLIIFTVAASIIFQTLTKNQLIGGYINSQTSTHNQFVELLVRLAVHVIQADGKVEAVELQTVKNFCHTHLNFSPSALLWVDDLMHRELQKRHPIDELVNELKRIPSPGLGLVVMDFLYQIAHSDFEFHAQEESVLVEIAKAWGLSDEDVRLIRNRYSTAKTQSTTSNSDAYQTLGLAPGATKDEIKDAYRRLVKQFHPDVVSHLGEDFKVLADQKMKSISAAYQQLT
jgi:DnaJ like chaperone protein